MARVTRFHLYWRCPEKKADRKKSGISIFAYRTTRIEVVSAHGRTEILGDLCAWCREQAVAANEIDDFNSVWFGLGPDNCTQPRRERGLLSAKRDLLGGIY